MPLVFGADSDSQVLPMLVDPLGRLLVDGHSYYSADWRKNPLAFGISGQVLQLVENTALTAGTNVLNTDAVPANTIWVITHIAMSYTGTVAGVQLRCRKSAGGAYYVIYNQIPPVTSVYYDRQGQWILLPTDKIQLVVYSATLNDDAYLVVTGYSIAYTA